MVTRKPVGGGITQSPTHRLSGGLNQTLSTSSYAGLTAEQEELEHDWNSRSEIDNIPNPPPPIPTSNVLRGAYEVEDVALGANTQAWRVNDPQPPVPSLATATDQLANYQDNGDLGIGNLSLSAPPSKLAPGDGINQTNPFLRKRSSPGTPSEPPESSAEIWDEPSTSNLSSSNIPPQLGPIPQDPIIRLDAEDPWGEFHNSAPGSEVTPSGVSSESHFSTNDKGKAPASSQPHIYIPTQLSASRPEVETPRTRATRERNEVYQIKHIRWFDAISNEVPRNSPILIQNANGPCPLLALVNALVLTTPPELITPLLETLRTREQVSLGLLLDAVFDELMSERRSGTSPNLPDVGDLYTFLVTLHTGMNVNPRFVPPSTLADSEEEEMPGYFEDTREMKLYSTFRIPLIHGWIPHRHELAYGAFQRTAQSYEDSQNVQFREEDLEQKVTLGVINEEDQEVLKDLTIIKQFFVYWPTQLTAHGLDVIKKFMQAGQIAILFRNDHFSMLYREPKSNRLMTLVTDAGYASHDEIVWESLVDINGSSSEWYSGDFRSVSHESEDAMYQDGWETVGSKPSSKRRTNIHSTQGQDAPVSDAATRKAIEAAQYGGLPEEGGKVPSASEQEDHDLALALQLQEEEEENQRNEIAARRARENEMSEQFISQQAGNLCIPPRRSGPQQNATPPVAASQDSEDNAPPPYEQAASGKPFIPPRSHPASEHAPLSKSSGSSSQASIAASYNQNPVAPGQSSLNPPRARLNSRQSLSQNQTAGSRRLVRSDTGMNSPQSDKEEKCILM